MAKRDMTQRWRDKNIVQDNSAKELAREKYYIDTLMVKQIRNINERLGPDFPKVFLKRLPNKYTILFDRKEPVVGSRKVAVLEYYSITRTLVNSYKGTHNSQLLRLLWDEVKHCLNTNLTDDELHNWKMMKALNDLGL